MFLVLALGAFTLLDRDDLRPGRLMAAGLLLVLAAFSKQVGVFFVGAACVYLIFRERRTGLIFSAACAVAGIAAALFYQWKTGGQFFFYTIDVGASHEMQPSKLFDAGTIAMKAGPLILGLVLAALVSKSQPEKPPRGLLWILFAAACVPAAMLPWAKVGRFDNDFIPLFVALCVLAARMERAWLRPFMLAQCALLLYNPFAQIPSPAARDAGDKFIALLADDAGTTYVMDHPYYSWLAGKPMYPKGMFVAEAQKAGRSAPPAFARLADDAAFDRIITDLQPPFDAFSSRLMRRYRVEGVVGGAQAADGGAADASAVCDVPRSGHLRERSVFGHSRAMDAARRAACFGRPAARVPVDLVRDRRRRRTARDDHARRRQRRRPTHGRRAGSRFSPDAMVDGKKCGDKPCRVVIENIGNAVREFQLRAEG
ncbi:MAG: hypothetical protein M5R36_02610 [Deltaproteobacteria bacterium]|nr:hypothetical protein [Deltaproteobacteria bacterium]